MEDDTIMEISPLDVLLQSVLPSTQSNALARVMVEFCRRVEQLHKQIQYLRTEHFIATGRMEEFLIPSVCSEINAFVSDIQNASHVSSQLGGIDIPPCCVTPKTGDDLNRKHPVFALGLLDEVCARYRAKIRDIDVIVRKSQPVPKNKRKINE